MSSDNPHISKIQSPIFSQCWYNKYKQSFFCNNESFPADHFFSKSAVNSEIAEIRKGEVRHKATGLTFKCEVV